MWSRYRAWLRALRWWEYWILAAAVWTVGQIVILNLNVGVAIVTGMIFATLIVGVSEYTKRKEQRGTGSD